jgi:hypothetical protein
VCPLALRDGTYLAPGSGPSVPADLANRIGHFYERMVGYGGPADGGRIDEVINALPEDEAAASPGRSVTWPT